MARGQLIISIDLELAWGVWDHLTPSSLGLAAKHERPICASLVELLDRHQIPVTWAIVAALLDEKSAAAQPGDKRCWYAPDVIEQIVNAKSRHEIGSHGGRHRYFDCMAPAQAREDLEFAREQHRAHALPFDAFVFPRNSIGHLDILRDTGLRAFRGPDRGWFMATGAAGRMAGRTANFVDKMLPIPPTPVAACALCSLQSHVRNSAWALFARATASASFTCGFIRRTFTTGATSSSRRSVGFSNRQPTKPAVGI